MDSWDSDTDLSSSLENGLSEKVRVDPHSGMVNVFGKNLHVGTEAAAAVSGLIEQAQFYISDYGAKYAKNSAAFAVKAIGGKDIHAFKAGNAAEFAWRFGLPVVDVGMGVKSAVSDGYKRLGDLKEDFSAVLAANNGMKVGMGGILTTHFSALAHERALIIEEEKKSVLATLAGTVKKIPNIILNVWAQKSAAIEEAYNNPEAREALATEAEKQRFDKLVAMKNPSQSQAVAGVQPDPVVSTFKRIFNPQSQADLQANLKFKMGAPIVGGLAGQLIEDHINKNTDNKTSAARLIKQLDNIIKEQEPSSGGDIEHYVRDIFQQQVNDQRVKQKLGGAKFNHIVEEVSESLVHDNLHPQALIELLDDKKVLAFNNKNVSYGKPSVVKEELSKFIEKYSANVSQKELYKGTEFTKEDALAAFKALSPEERPIYTMMFKPGELEAAGADKDEVLSDRKRGKQYFHDEMSDIVQNILASGRKELEKKGVKPEYIDDLEAIERDFTRAMERGRGSEYIAQNPQETINIVRNMALTAKDKEGFWREYVQKRVEEDISPRIPAHARTSQEHAERDSGEDLDIGR